jgi:tripartite ATP-independent transporter DctM subunit
MALLGLSLILLALLGAPLFAVIAASAMLGFYRSEIDLSVVAIEFYRIAEMPILLAIPLFTFAGYLLSESRAPQRLVRLTQALLGWLPGGLAIVALVACALFTAFTGASGVTIVALGALLYPALTQAGYGKDFSLGLVTTSGSLGLLFAPALPLILYAVIAQQLGIAGEITVDAMFLAGLLPGLLMLLLLVAWSFWSSRGLPVRRFSRGEAWRALREAVWEIPLPFVVLGGVYSGFFAISEAAAVTALYVLIVEVLIQREIPLRQLPEVMRKAMLMVGGILLILGVSLASTNYLIDAEVPSRLFATLRELVSDKLTFLILLNLFLLVLGTMLDIFSALVLMIPLLLPVAIGYGVDPIHLGIIFLANMQIGYFTPPVGMNLFIASYRFDKPVMQLYRATLPWFAILFLAVLIITYWPDLSLWLVGMVD